MNESESENANAMNVAFHTKFPGIELARNWRQQLDSNGYIVIPHFIRTEDQFELLREVFDLPGTRQSAENRWIDIRLSLQQGPIASLCRSVLQLATYLIGKPAQLIETQVSIVQRGFIPQTEWHIDGFGRLACGAATRNRPPGPLLTGGLG